MTNLLKREILENIQMEGINAEELFFMMVDSLENCERKYLDVGATECVLLGLRNAINDVK